MKDRIKYVRKDLGMTQEKLADYLGVPLTNIKSYELGRRSPSNAFVSLLASKSNFNESWLLTGEGDPKQPATRQQDIAEVAIAMRNADPESARYQIMKLLAQMSDDDIDVIYRLTMTLAGMLDKNKPQD